MDQQTDRPTDRPTNLPIEAPFRSLKINAHYSTAKVKNYFQFFLILNFWKINFNSEKSTITIYDNWNQILTFSIWWLASSAKFIVFIFGWAPSQPYESLFRVWVSECCWVPILAKFWSPNSDWNELTWMVLPDSKMQKRIIDYY